MEAGFGADVVPATSHVRPSSETETVKVSAAGDAWNGDTTKSWMRSISGAALAARELDVNLRASAAKFHRVHGRVVDDHFAVLFGDRA